MNFIHTHTHKKILGNAKSLACGRRERENLVHTCSSWRVQVDFLITFDLTFFILMCVCEWRVLVDLWINNYICLNTCFDLQSVAIYFLAVFRIHLCGGCVCVWLGGCVACVHTNENKYFSLIPLIDWLHSTKKLPCWSSCVHFYPLLALNTHTPFHLWSFLSKCFSHNYISFPVRHPILFHTHTLDKKGINAYIFSSYTPKSANNCNKTKIRLLKHFQSVIILANGFNWLQKVLFTTFESL